MKTRRLVVSALTIAALILPFPASAEHGCNGFVRQLSFNTTGLYVDDRTATGGQNWIYLETNGVPFLQSGGLSLGLEVRDPCEHGSPDQLVAVV